MSVRNQGMGMLNDPDTKEKIRRIAYEHGMTLEEAKIHFTRHQND